MASSTNRITGLATGMDIDSIIEETMKAYQTKVDKKKQEKDIIEIKQQLYRDLIKDGQDFYNKYFDITKSDSLLSSKNYKSVAFKSSDELVCTANATSSAVKDNYTVEVKELATTARMDIGSSDLTANGDLKFTVGSNEILIKANELKDKSAKEQAKILNSKLSNYGLKATASDFSSGKIVIQTTKTGSDAAFSVSYGSIVDETFEAISSDNIENKSYDVGSLLSDSAQDMKFTNGDKSVIIKASDLKNVANSFQKQIDDKKNEMNKESDDSKKTTLQNEIAELEKNLEKNKANAVLSTINSKLSSVGLQADIDKDSDGNIITKDDGKYVIDIKSKKESETFKIEKGTYKAAYLNKAGAFNEDKPYKGTNLKATIKNSLANNDNSIGTIVYDGSQVTSSNTITLDGVEFNLTATGTARIVGSTDTTDMVKKIKEFVEDYNSLVTSLTKYTTENKNRDYAPLTDDQKEELSDDEIKKWEEKVKQGQLKGDNDLTRILNSLKSCVEVTLGSTMSLEDIGIEQVEDYSSTKKNNLKIDETKLIEALENNSEEIAKMFTDSENGIMTRMKNTLYDEFVSSTKSALIQKAGYEGTTYFTQNTLTKQLNEYNTKISEMEKEMKTKEQDLYSKWANIETAMQKLNAQLSNLQSYFGGSSY